METITLLFCITLVWLFFGILSILKFNYDIGIFFISTSIIVGIIWLTVSFNKECPTTKIPVHVFIFDHKSKLTVEVNDVVESPFEFTKLEDRSMFSAKKFYIQNYKNYWGMELPPHLKWEN